jgi:4-carboxymuconolactone decarboxylase
MARCKPDQNQYCYGDDLSTVKIGLCVSGFELLVDIFIPDEHCQKEKRRKVSVDDQKKTPAAEKMMKELLPFVQKALDAIDPEFGEILIHQIFNCVYGREDQLDIKTRELCTVAMLTVLGRLDDLKTHIRVAFNLGWSAPEIKEILLLCAIPGGWPASFDGLRILDAHCKDAGTVLEPPLAIRPGYEETNWVLAGRANGTRFLGKDIFDNLVSEISSEGDDFRDFIISTVYGKLLSRNVLDERTRYLCMIAAFAALKSGEHLVGFISGSLKNGVDPGEIREVLLYCCIYAGQEAMLQAMKIYRQCIKG